MVRLLPYGTDAWLYIYIYQSDGYMKYHEIIHPFLSNFHNLWVCLKMGYTHKWL